MAIEWKYIENQFVNSTENSFQKAMKLSNYHDANLNAQKVTYAALVPLYDRYHPLHLDLVDKYTKWSSEVGYREGRTQNVADLLEETYANLFLWDLEIQQVHNAKTPEYKGYFAEGRKVFTNGTLESRIGAYNTLQDRLGTNPLLATVKQDILDAYIDLDAARDTQTGSKGTIKTKSGLLKTAVVNAMTMQYRNLGICMDAFTATPNITVSLFDLDTLRFVQQTYFTGTISIGGKDAIFMRTLLADSKLELRNNGLTDITFYYSNKKGGINSTGITVPADTIMTIEIREFNVPEYGTYRHLTAVNKSSVTEAIYAVLIK